MSNSPTSGPPPPVEETYEDGWRPDFPDRHPYEHDAIREDYALSVAGKEACKALDGWARFNARTPAQLAYQQTLTLKRLDALLFVLP